MLRCFRPRSADDLRRRSQSAVRTMNQPPRPMRTGSLSCGVAKLTKKKDPSKNHRDSHAPPLDSRVYARISVACPRHFGFTAGTCLGSSLRCRRVEPGRPHRPSGTSRFSRCLGCWLLGFGCWIIKPCSRKDSCATVYPTQARQGRPLVVRCDRWFRLGQDQLGNKLSC